MLRRKRVFTLIELVTVVIVIGILSGLGVVGYNQVLENAKAKVCNYNILGLDKAVEIYTLENDAFPASLGQLRKRDLERAYAEVFKGEELQAKMAYWFVKVNIPHQAYAEAFLTPENLGRYGVSKKLFHCPADVNGGTSYGINEDLSGLAWSDIPEGTPLVADSDTPTFNSATIIYRHKDKLFSSEGEALVGLKGKKKGRKGKKAEINGKLSAARDTIDALKEEFSSSCSAQGMTKNQRKKCRRDKAKAEGDIWGD